MALLEISKVCLSFSGLRALIDVSFDVAEGGIVGLIGPNGAGKSTLLNCISCLYRPENGQIRFDGRTLPTARAIKSPRWASAGHSRILSCFARRACGRM